MAYRKDIDGLRALAVVPVVLYHAGFSLFSGGYVGVDVFFVISGYLITGIISEEIRQQRFSVLHFYERRIRRIFPALFVVLLFTMIAGLILLLPEDLIAMSKSLVAATLFSSNILFWRESGYFDTAAELKPLLHTWSLAVEEQFYIFFPLFLMLAWRWIKNGWQAATWACLIISFALSIYGLRYHDEATFYLLPMRAWELLMGSVIALGAVPPLPNRKWREVLAALGIGLILYAVLAYDQSTPFPGEYALAPCLGAALIIHAGRDASAPTWTARLLSLQPVVFIGLISYSLYLWHWPLIVYAKYIAIFPLTTWQSAAIVATGVAMATLSWRYVEAPFRKGNGTFFTRSRARLFAMSGAIMAGAIVISLATIILHGLPMRMNPAAIEIVATAKAPQKVFTQCINYRKKDIFKKPEKSCVFGNEHGEASILLWGDSHAGAILPGALTALKDSNIGIRTLIMTGCPPLLGIHLSYNETDTCYKYNLEVIRYIKTSTAKTVILGARWAPMLGGPVNLDHDKATPGISDAAGKVVSIVNARRLLATSLDETIQAILGSGKKVILVYPVPESTFDIPNRLSQSLRFHGTDSLPMIVISRHDFNYRSGEVIRIFDSLPDRANFSRLRPDDMLCVETSCLTIKDGQALYFDDNHLSMAGAELLAPLFAPLLNTSAN